MTCRLFLLAISIISSISAICPKRWTGIMALVFGVIAFSINSGTMLNISGSVSTNTGVAPSLLITPAVAKNVNGDVITSSPGPIFNAIRERSKASVPDATPMPCLTSQYAAKFASSSFTSGPRIKPPCLKTPAIADSISL